MTDLLAARVLMGFSLAFHILFAMAGMAMPLLMVLAEGRWLLGGDPVDLDLAKRWAKGTAILFAVGAVSGTTLSFELGLLWPHFMEVAGPVTGLAFAFEGVAFFLEAIFLGIYLYGWERVSPLAHWGAGVGVFLAGQASAVFIMTVNAWMNSPTGFRFQDGRAVDIDPWEAMLGSSSFQPTMHMMLAALASVGFAVAAIHAAMLLRHPASRFHRRALELAMPLAIATALLQPVSGDRLARQAARLSPLKLAAMEAHFETMAWAPLRVGGWPDEVRGTVPYGLEIPGLLSVLASGSPSTVVKGLFEVPPEDRPPVLPVHLAFQLMVACGIAMAVLALVSLVCGWKAGGLPTQPWLLSAWVLAGPLGVVATEAGWVVTEVGRQPWVIHGVLRTAEAVTPVTGLTRTLAAFGLLYLGLGAVVAVLLRRLVLASPVGRGADAGP